MAIDGQVVNSRTGAPVAVMDEGGNSVQGASVNATLYVLSTGKRELSPGGALHSQMCGASIGSARPPVIITFALFRRVQCWRTPGYGPEFYGGTDAPNIANRVKVELGKEKTGIDFRLTRRQGASVSGRILLPTTPERLPELPLVMLISEDSSWITRIVQPDWSTGTFVIDHVQPGTVDPSRLRAPPEKPGIHSPWKGCCRVTTPSSWGPQPPIFCPAWMRAFQLRCDSTTGPLDIGMTDRTGTIVTRPDKARSIAG